MRALLVAVVALAACSSGRPPPPPPTADALVGAYVAVSFGAPIAEARRALPRLAPSGWQEGVRATWLDPETEAGLEIETDADKVRAVALTFGPDRAAAVEAELRARLGQGVECGALPEGISSFRPTLWRTSDGAAVSLLRKQRFLQLRVERPAGTAFEEAWTSCRR